MKIKTVEYSALINLGNYSNEKIGFTAEIHEAITPVAYEQLLSAPLYGVTTIEVCQIQDTTRPSGPDNCGLGTQCRCG